MTPQQYQRVTEIFEAALRCVGAERDGLIAEACAADAEVNRAVRRMLAQHAAPAFDLDSAALGDQIDFGSLSPGGADSRAVPAMPRRIGPYEILGVLGEGGMSVVYRARQEFPTRTVALKVLRAGALTPAALRRFHAEVQTLAKLSHPNIAQVYAAGSYTHTCDNGGQSTDKDDRPYFAMEIVEGLPLTEFARKHHLTVPQKLRVMIDVCLAVQHAHLRGVIHRDLKPGNILVEDGIELHHGVNPATNLQPRPKVLDFGIARATDLDVTRATLAVETGRIVGTLPYMSPEQLAGDVAAIDLRCDVYALGVLLFELLAGRLPHAISDQMPLTQTAQVLATTEPQRLGQVDRSLRGELEVIVATALERDRTRRYQSAEALADDLLAHLEHRPIRARPPGPLLRARKWVRRRPAVATAVTILIMALLAIGAVIGLQRQRAKRDAALELARLLTETRDGVQAYAADFEASRRRAIELADVRNTLYRYNPPARAEELEQQELHLLRIQNEHEAALHRLADSLGRVQQLGAGEDEVRRLRARLYLARLREAEAAGDRFARSTYLELVRQNDPNSELAGEMIERFTINILTDPPGAEAHLFQMIEQSEWLNDGRGEPRLVPVPIAWNSPEKAGGQGAIPGQFAMRVIDGGDALHDEDLVLGIGHDHDHDGTDNAVRDAVFVISAPSATGLQPLDRLASIDGQQVRGMYDANPPPHVASAPSNANRVSAPGDQAKPSREFAFERRTDPSASSARVALHGASLDAMGIRVGDAAQALREAGGLATVWRRGEVTYLPLPPGLEFRITAKPLLAGSGSHVGVTPITNVTLGRGQYVLLLLMPGYEPIRIPLDIHENGTVAAMRDGTVRLLTKGTTLAGFVRAWQWFVADAEPFWMMEREVTLGEYLEFLNDPETRVAIDTQSSLYYPRSGGLMECGRDADGTFNTGPELRADCPVLAISWNDAKAYAEWRTRRARAVGEIAADYEFGLPTHQEWLAAWACGSANQYPWGMHFRPHWTSSNYAHALPAPEEVMRFPIDESNIGVYDLAGSVSEWLDAWWIEERNQREVAGGSWGHGGGMSRSDMFMLYGQNGMSGTVTNGTCGFRLVMRRITTASEVHPEGGREEPRSP